MRWKADFQTDKARAGRCAELVSSEDFQWLLKTAWGHFTWAMRTGEHTKGIERARESVDMLEELAEPGRGSHRVQQTLESDAWVERQDRSKHRCSTRRPRCRRPIRMSGILGRSWKREP